MPPCMRILLAQGTTRIQNATYSMRCTSDVQISAVLITSFNKITLEVVVLEQSFAQDP